MPWPSIRCMFTTKKLAIQCSGQENINPIWCDLKGMEISLGSGGQQSIVISVMN